MFVLLVILLLHLWYFKSTNNGSSALAPSWAQILKQIYSRWLSISQIIWVQKLLVDLGHIQNTQNFYDSGFAILDNSDNTKTAKFEASGITTATTRTFYTLPNASGYISFGYDIPAVVLLILRLLVPELALCSAGGQQLIWLVPV